eukprot:scaffold434_cov358-Prasinococcus_capsulatus_cf.AAC.14
MDKPAVVILQEQGGFVLLGGLGYNPKAFLSSEKNDILTAILAAAANIGIQLVVDNTTVLTVERFRERQTHLRKQNDCLETPLGQWNVTRVSHTGKLVGRLLVLTKNYLVERRPEDYETVSKRPLKAIAAIVRHYNLPQRFQIEYTDGCPAQTYLSTVRFGHYSAPTPWTDGKIECCLGTDERRRC